MYSQFLTKKMRVTLFGEFSTAGAPLLHTGAARTFERGTNLRAGVRRLRCAARCPIDEQTSAIRAENRVGVWFSINIRTSHEMNEILTTAHTLTFWFDLES